MPLMSATLSEITSNARLKDYPVFSILQVANAPIFRQPGYEPRQRGYDVPPKGEASDPERSKESSRNRARSCVRDIAFCNRFDYFFTWTLDSKLIDRYDPEIVGKKVRTFLMNASNRKGFLYVVVPELHLKIPYIPKAVHHSELFTACALAASMAELATERRWVLSAALLFSRSLSRMH